ncbi:MAG: FxDxF family PEP-CTERM protein [Burkholderiaceae bacterium]
MKLKSLIAATALAFASATASAAVISGTLTTDGSGLWTANFGNSVLVTGAFSDTVNFSPVLSGSATGSTISIAFAGTGQAGDIDFTSVVLNGVSYDVTNNTLVNGAYYDTAILPLTAVTGPLSLVVNGYAYAPASWSGTLNVAAVPEPGTLALIGIASVGLGVFRRRAAKNKDA